MPAHHVFWSLQLPFLPDWHCTEKRLVSMGCFGFRRTGIMCPRLREIGGCTSVCQRRHASRCRQAFSEFSAATECTNFVNQCSCVGCRCSSSWWRTVPAVSPLARHDVASPCRFYRLLHLLVCSPLQFCRLQSSLVSAILRLYHLPCWPSVLPPEASDVAFATLTSKSRAPTEPLRLDSFHCFLSSWRSHDEHSYALPLHFEKNCNEGALC